MESTHTKGIFFILNLIGWILFFAIYVTGVYEANLTSLSLSENQKLLLMGLLLASYIVPLLCTMDVHPWTKCLLLIGGLAVCLYAGPFTAVVYIVLNLLHCYVSRPQ